MNILVRNSLYFLSLAPLWGIVIRGVFDASPNWVFGAIFSVISILYLIHLLVNKKNIQLPFYIILFILLFLYYFIWGYITNFKETDSFVEFFYKNPALFTIFILLIVENSLFDREFIENIIKIFKATIVISFIVTIIQAVFIDYFLVPEYLLTQYSINLFGTLRFPSIFGYIDPNELGFSFLPLLSIVIGYQLSQKNKIDYLLIIFGGVVAFLSSSRYIQFSFIIVLIQLLITRGVTFKNAVKFGIFLVTCFFFFILMIIFSGINLENYLYTRLLAESAYSRIIGASLFLEYYWDSFLFGYGTRLTNELYYALQGASPYIHIGYLSHLFEFGLIGSLLIFSAWFMIVKRAYIVGRKYAFYGSFFAFLVFLFTNATLVEYSIFHYGLIFAIIFIKYFENNHKLIEK